MSKNSDSKPRSDRAIFGAVGTLALLLFAVSAAAAPEGSAALIAKAVAATSSTRADFVQRFLPRGFTRERAEKGSVIFGVLPQMRWTYVEPDRKVFVFDGSTSWFYSAEDDEVTIHHLTDADRDELPLVVLSDPSRGLAQFSTVVRAGKRGTSVEFTPLKAGGAIRRFGIEIDGATGRITSIDWDDREGNHTTFEFTGFAPAKTDGATFRFDPPTGVDVIEN